MISISDRVERLSASQTLAMSQKSAELKAAGIDVINLSVGEPDFNTPAHIKKAACRAVADNFSHYSPVPGYLSLREAIAERQFDLYGYRLDPQQIVVGNGAKQALCNVILTTLNPGDEAIIPVPAWVSYMEMVKLAGGKCVTVATTMESDFKMTPEQLEAAITPSTRMLIMNSPSNPTGSVYTHGELQALVKVLERHGEILVISDEVYDRINYDGPSASLASFPEIADRCVLINGVSKTYAMTGWRIGYCAAPANFAKAVVKLQGQYTSGASSIAQKAAETAYLGPQDCVKEMVDAFRRRRDLVTELITRIPGIKLNKPAGAFYIFPDVRELIGKSYHGHKIASSYDLAMYLLEQAHVATVDGGAFCTPGFLRLSYAADENSLREAIKRISDSLE